MKPLNHCSSFSGFGYGCEFKLVVNRQKLSEWKNPTRFSKGFFKSDDVKIEKWKFRCFKNPIIIKDVEIENITISNKFSCSKNVFHGLQNSGNSFMYHVF